MAPGTPDPLFSASSMSLTFPAFSPALGVLDSLGTPGPAAPVRCRRSATPPTADSVNVYKVESIPLKVSSGTLPRPDHKGAAAGEAG
ncbi:hypothetical protein STXM2123_5827 [Streptomyces sp. F-3]|nr:hypothetical protein STXM2123_5827 [Streptomyces sp. F-3]